MNSGKESASSEGDVRRGFYLSAGKIPLEEAVATCSSILAWRIPWTEEPGGLQSIGLHRVRQDWSNLAWSVSIPTAVAGCVRTREDGREDFRKHSSSLWIRFTWKCFLRVTTNDRNNNNKKTLHWNTQVHIYFQVSGFGFEGTCPGVWLLDHMVSLVLLFKAIPVLFSIVTVPIYIPTNSVGGFPFLHILANTCYLLGFW